MNNRFKEIREKLGFSQEKFGEIIGLSKSGISNIESGQRNVTDKHIKLLCSELNINPDWLRTGEGKMFNESDEFSLDEYAKQNKLTALEFDILKTYMELDSDVRKNLMSNLKAIFNKHDTTEITHITSSNEPTIEELEEEYKKRHSKSVSQTEVSASNGIGGNRNKVV